MVEFNEGIDFKEESEYQQEGFSIKEIILRHIRKIGDICCQEFTGSYWEKKPMKTQSGIMFTEVYHQDIREAYCNAIDFLVDIIYPMGDKLLKDYIDTNDKDYTTDEVKDNIKAKRKLFKQINLMFERNNFWQSSGVSNE